MLLLVVSIITVLALAAIVVTVLVRKRAAEGNVIKIGIDIWPGFAPFYVGVEKGFFKEEGIDVRPEIIIGTGERNAALTGNRVQGLCTTVDAFVAAAAQGVPLRIVSSVDESLGGDGLVANSEIKSIKDLVGKRIALQTGMPSHFFLLYLLEKEGIDPKKVEIVATEAPDAAAAFIAGKVDAAVTWEPWLSKAAARDHAHLLATSKEYPEILIDVLAINSDFANKHPDQVCAVLRGWFRSVAFCKSNPDEANRIMAKALNMSSDEFGDILSTVRLSDLPRARELIGLTGTPSRIAHLVDASRRLWQVAGVIADEKEVPDDIVAPAFLEKLK
jgi:NitT/TauT family transport system substrate-binding protein